MDQMNQVPDLIHRLFAVRNKLGGLFLDFDPSFTLFAEFEIGLVWAAYVHGLQVWDVGGSPGGPNALAPDGRLVQVWASSDGEAYRSAHRQAEGFLAFFLSVDGDPRVVYDGPTSLIFANVNDKPLRCLRRRVSFPMLRRLMPKVPRCDQLPLVRPIPKRAGRWRDCPAKGSFRRPPVGQIPALIREFYSATFALDKIFSNQNFRPVHFHDGPTAQAWAAYLYGLTDLRDESYDQPNAKTPDGRIVHVRSNHGMCDDEYVTNQAEHLLVLRLDWRGHPEEIYNGPNALAWRKARRMAGNDDTRRITVSALKRLMAQVPKEQRLPLLRPWPRRSR